MQQFYLVTVFLLCLALPLHALASSSASATQQNAADGVGKQKPDTGVAVQPGDIHNASREREEKEEEALARRLLFSLASLPRNPDGRFLDKDGARAIAVAATRLAPTYAETWLRLAELEDVMAQPWRALHAYFKALAEDPSAKVVSNALVLARMRFMENVVETSEWLLCLHRLGRLKEELKARPGAARLPSLQPYLKEMRSHVSTFKSEVGQAAYLLEGPPALAADAGRDEDGGDELAFAAHASYRGGVAQRRLPPSLPLLRLFATPLFHHNLAELGLMLEAEVAEVNAAITALVAEKYASLDTYLRKRGGGKAVALRDVNDAFFKWQMRALNDERRVISLRLCTGWHELGHLPGFAALCGHVRTVLRALMAQTGTAPALGASEDIYAWASHHGRGSSHRVHTHGDSLWSAVYYTAVPPGSGAIRFYDPRGSIDGGHDLETRQGWASKAPFLHWHEVRPRAGDLVIFPSWLLHEVRSSYGDPQAGPAPPRVSIAFNLIGYWDAPTDASG